MSQSRLVTVRSNYPIVDANERGIGFPFLRGQTGMFSRRFGLDVIIDDIVALLYINPGEYPNNPELGVGIHRFLFELQHSTLGIELESRIEAQILKYIKNVILLGVDIKQSTDDKQIDVTVRFKKIQGSREIIRMSLSVNPDQNKLEAGVEL